MNEIVRDILVEIQISGRKLKVKFDNFDGVLGKNEGENDGSKVNCHEMNVKERLDWSIVLVKFRIEIEMLWKVDVVMGLLMLLIVMASLIIDMLYFNVIISFTLSIVLDMMFVDFIAASEILYPDPKLIYPNIYIT